MKFAHRRELVFDLAVFGLIRSFLCALSSAFLGDHMSFFSAEHGVIHAALHMDTRGAITGYEKIVRAEFRNRLASHFSMRLFALCEDWIPRRRRCASIRKCDF